jgi:hypothetical protein
VFRATFAAAWGRKRRLAATALAVLLGVAFLAARQLAGAVVEAVAQPHGGDHLVDPLPVGAPARQPQG